MSRFIGRLIKFGLGKETTRGTAVSPSFWVPLISIDFDNVFDIESSAQRYDLIGEFGETMHTIYRKAEGIITGEIDANSFGLLMLSAFGQVSTTGPVDSAYTHTFSIQDDNAHDSLTLVEVNPIGSYQYSFAMLRGLEIIVSSNTNVEFSASFISRRGILIANPVVSYSARKLFTGSHCYIKIADNVAGLGAASAISLSSLKFVFEKNVIDSPMYDTLSAQTIVNQAIGISGSFELPYENRAYQDYLKDESTKALRIQFVSNQLIGVSSVPQFTLDLSKVVFDVWESNKTSDEVVNQSINFKALYSSADGNIVNDCKLINETVSY